MSSLAYWSCSRDLSMLALRVIGAILVAGFTILLNYCKRHCLVRAEGREPVRQAKTFGYILLANGAAVVAIFALLSTERLQLFTFLILPSVILLTYGIQLVISRQLGMIWRNSLFSRLLVLAPLLGCTLVALLWWLVR